MLADIDWNAAWKEEQELRRNADNVEYWDNRAPSFAKTAGSSPYANEFLERAGVLEGETVFDMGCGSGTLALPLARAGHHVFAGDFSTAMIDLMMQRAELEGLADLIHPVSLAWDADWSRIEIPVCDLAFASRSIATADMATALVKLDSMARRRVCLTLTTGVSPRTDAVLLQAVGRKLPRYPDCVYAFNILWGLGIMPEVSYINSVRQSEFESFEQAIEKTCEIMELSSIERTRLIEYSAEHLREVRGPDKNTHWEYDHQRVVSWAFIAWDKSG